MSIERTDVNVQMLVNECAKATRRHLEALLQVYLNLVDDSVDRDIFAERNKDLLTAKQTLGEVIDGLEITADKLEQLETKT